MIEITIIHRDVHHPEHHYYETIIEINGERATLWIDERTEDQFKESGKWIERMRERYEATHD